MPPLHTMRWLGENSLTVMGKARPGADLRVNLYFFARRNAAFKFFSIVVFHCVHAGGIGQDAPNARSAVDRIMIEVRNGFMAIDNRS